MSERPAGVAPDLIIMGAFRYALGRQTYIVSTTQDYIRFCWPYMEERTKRVIKRDIREAQELGEKGDSWGGLGDKKVDAPGWLAILELDGPDDS